MLLEATRDMMILASRKLIKRREDNVLRKE